MVFRRLICCLLLSATCTGVSFAAGQHLPSSSSAQATLANNQLCDFSAYAETLSTQNGVTIVSEGFPIHLHLTDDEAKKLAGELSSQKTMREMIGTVASAYDYSPIWVSNTLCLWQKRYTSTEDIPDISLEESLQRLGNMKILYQDYLTTRRSGDYARDVIKLFPLTEVGKEEDVKFVDVSSLDTAKRNALRGFAIATEIGMRFRGINGISEQLQSCRSNKPVLTVEKYDTATYPIFKWQSAPLLGQPSYENTFAISSVALTIPGSRSFHVPDDVSHGPNPKEATATYINNDSIIALSKLKKEVPAAAVTIADVVEQLKPRWSEELALAVDPAVAQKRVCIFHGEYTNPFDLAAGVAKVHGLQLGKRRRLKNLPSQWTIAVPLVHKPTPGEDFSGMVIEQIPPPLYHSMLTATPKEEPNTWNAIRQEKMYGMYATALIPLRGIADKALESSDTKSVPFAQLPAEAKDDIACASMISLLPEWIPLSRPLSPIITDFNQAQVGVTISLDPQSSKNRRLFLGHRYDVDGRGAGINSRVGIPIE